MLHRPPAARHGGGADARRQLVQDQVVGHVIPLDLVDGHVVQPVHLLTAVQTFLVGQAGSIRNQYDGTEV